MSATYQQAVNLIQTSWRTQKVPNVCNIPTSWYRVSHRHHGTLKWCPVPATYQQVDIESHTAIIANLVGTQCLQHTNKLISRVTQTLQRT